MKFNAHRLKILAMLLLASGLQAQVLEWSTQANPMSNSVNGVAFRADGQKVISGTNCHPASIRIFDVSTGNMDWDFTVGSEFMCIMGVTFSSNMNYISAIEEFGNIFIFDNTGALPVLIDTINTGTSYGFSTAISPLNDRVAVGCSNGKMKIYTLPGGNETNSISAHSSWVTTVAYSPDGANIITGGSDNRVKIWSNTGALRFTCTGHTDDITSVRVTPDNKRVVSSAKDDKIKIWDMATGALLQTISGHTGNVNGIDVSPDGTKLVSASSDATCKIWNLANGNLISTFGLSDNNEINTVAWSPLGNKVFTGNASSDVALWDVAGVSGSGEAAALAADIQIWPNPASTLVHIQLPETLRFESVRLLDVSGKVLLTENADVRLLNVAKFMPGVYQLQLLNGTKILASKNVVKL